MINWANVLLGLQVTGWGLLGVFGVLLLFYVVMILLDKIEDKEEEQPE